MGEIVRAEHRGKAVGTVQSGWAIGWGAAALLYTLMFSVLSEEWAWRIILDWCASRLLVLYIRKTSQNPRYS